MACANEYAKEEKEKNMMFSAKFHVVLIKYNRDYLLSNTLIITIYQWFCCIVSFVYKRIVLKVGFRCAFY